MYSKIFKNILFPFYDSFLRRRKILLYLEELEKNQWLSQEQLRDIQWKKLKKLLKHAYENVPYYRKKFDERGLCPENIKGPEDFRKLPILTREEVQDNQENLIASNYKKTKLLYKMTSGSTGIPLSFKHDLPCYQWHMAGVARSDRWAGWDYGEKELHIWGVSPLKKDNHSLKKMKKDLHFFIIRKKMINAFDFSQKNLGKIVREINNFKPKVIIAYVNPLYNLAKYIKNRKLNCFSPQAIITSAEKLYPFQRSLIEEVFNAKIFDRYGSQEVMLIAAECEEHEGMHMNIDNLYIEILKDNRQVKRQELGEIVITDLNGYGMPLIRYSTGDMGGVLEHNCSCGRGFPLMNMNVGRLLDIIVTPEGNLVPGEAFLYPLEIVKWAKQFRVVQENKECVTIEFVKEKNCSPLNGELERIEKNLRRIVGNRINIGFRFVEEIPLTKAGKYRVVVSKVPIDFGNN